MFLYISLILKVASYFFKTFDGFSSIKKILLYKKALINTELNIFVSRDDEIVKSKNDMFKSTKICKNCSNLPNYRKKQLLKCINALNTVKLKKV